MIEIYIVILNIIIAEILMFLDYILYGLGVYIIGLLTTVLLIIFGRSDIKAKYVLQSLILVMLLRVVNLSVPPFFTIDLLQISLIYGIMFLPVLLVIKNQRIPLEELGINFKRFYIYLPIGLLIGIVMAIIEYNILNPTALIEKIRFSNIILISIVMFIFVATIEESVFRGILQTRLQKIFGSKYGILLSGIIFGAFHLGQGMIDEAIFASIYGIFIGYIFQKTNNIPFIISIHGTNNVILFGILPLYIM